MMMTKVQIYQFQELEGEKLFWYQFLRTKFQIIINNNEEIKYVTDGQILRIDHNKDPQKPPEILNNLEQIKYLQWHGQYGQNLKKVGKWKTSWKGQILKNIGGQYTEDGKKIGAWRELRSNYTEQEQAQVYEVGEYFDDQRIGEWKYFFGDQEIGGGDYNEQGLKDGNWIDLSELFQKDKQITYNGMYNFGKKIGRWTECLRQNGYQSFTEIGGGYYDNQGKELKVGIWIELIDFRKDKQVTFNGLYQNGYKIGRWNILSDEYLSDSFEIIGGGSYDQQGLKNGKWIELNDSFFIGNNIKYCGEYKKSEKVGIWDLYWSDDRQAKLMQNTYTYQLTSGGGLFEIENGQLKNGNWIDSSDNFEKFRQITNNGVYKNGKKFGQWKTYWRESAKDNFIYCSGGNYHQFEFGIKEGKWTELNETFTKSNQTIYEGEYKNNKKVGRWNILLRRDHSLLEKIGGGNYNYENGLKQGKWIELWDNFRDDSQVTYNGEYKNGQRIGRWDIYYREILGENFELIGGGSYDMQKQGIKQGNWIELSDTFSNWSQTIYQGQYLNSMKVGKWEEKKRDCYAFSKRFVKKREMFFEV